MWQELAKKWIQGLEGERETVSFGPLPCTTVSLCIATKEWSESWNQKRESTAETMHQHMDAEGRATRLANDSFCSLCFGCNSSKKPLPPEKTSYILDLVERFYSSCSQKIKKKKEEKTNEAKIERRAKKRNGKEGDLFVMKHRREGEISVRSFQRWNIRNAVRTCVTVLLLFVIRLLLLLLQRLNEIANLTRFQLDVLLLAAHYLSVKPGPRIRKESTWQRSGGLAGERTSIRMF